MPSQAPPIGRVDEGEERAMADLLAAVRRNRLSLFALGMVVLVAWLVWSARGALPAFVIGLALAFVLDPVVTRIQRLGMPRWAGVLAAYAMVVALVWVLIAFALPPIGRQARELIERGPELGAAIGAWEADLARWYATLSLPPELRDMIDASVARGREAFGEILQALAGPVVGTLVRTATFVLGLVIIPVWLFFVLKDREAFPRTVAAALPPAWRLDADAVLAIIARIGGRWVRGQLLLGASIFVASAIGLTFLTVIGFRELGEFTLVLALIAGVLEWFPIIGPIIAAVPAILIALTISPAAVIAVIILYTAVQQLENNLLVPKVMGDAVELHPAVMIVALVIGGALFGIGGAILAAPTVAVGRDLYRYGFRRLSGEEPLAARRDVLDEPVKPVQEPDVELPATEAVPPPGD
jgi:predicted PurR-regulated permease PerM